MSEPRRPAKPPPRWALSCPDGHVRWHVRRGWFYCEGCDDGEPTGGRLSVLRNKRTGEEIPHEAFVERWGTEPYGDRRR